MLELFHTGNEYFGMREADILLDKPWVVVYIRMQAQYFAVLLHFFTDVFYQVLRIAVDPVQ